MSTELAGVARTHTRTAFKDSRVPWVGQIPKHWTIDRIKWTAACVRNGAWGSEPAGNDDLVCVRVADFDRNAFRVRIDEPTLRTVTLPERLGRLLERGDLLLEKSGGGDLQPVGAVVLFNHDLPAVCSNFVAKVPPAPGFEPEFLVYLHAHLYASRVNTRSIKQTTGIQNLDSSAYFDERASWPPLDEQRAIAAFLDRETARIDALIEKKRRQIELLHEKRAALISHAVTRGLDPSARMKDSGIEWLGPIPAHWETPPLYARFSVELGKMLDAKRITGERLLPYVRNVDVQWDDINVADLPEMDVAPDEYPRYTLKKGDLLVCEGGEVGRTAIWHGELPVCAFQKALHRLRPLGGRDLPRFFYYVMRATASTGVFVAHGNPNTIPHLTGEKLRVYRFAFPPTAEQGAIVNFLDTEAQKIDALVEKIHVSIERLREYRTALISAAVTGKIDVREQVPMSESKPARVAPLPFRRSVAGAEIAHRLHSDPTFGRVKFQKVVYLCEYHVGMDFDGNYQRQVAGPFDNQMLRSIESQISKQQWYAARADGDRTVYVPLQRAGAHRGYFDRYWSAQRVPFDALIDLVRPMATEHVEIVATLFAAWNDFLLEGRSPTDAEVVREVLTNWHESKERFDAERLGKALEWMRKKGLVPTGRGKKTVIAGRHRRRKEQA